MPKSIQKRLLEIIEPAGEGDTASRLFDVTILIIIVVNTLAVVLETVPALYAQYERVFHATETVILILFSIEYIARVWAAPASPAYRHPLWGRLRFVLTPIAMIDLVAVRPFYFPLFVPIEAGVLRTVRLLRLLRVLKGARYTQATNTIIAVVQLRKRELFIGFMIMLLMLLFSSTILYMIENQAQPEEFASIPHAAWWAVATLTTIGYGDVVPITPLGKVLGGIIALVGVGIFALPSAILASGFFQVLQERKES